MLLVVDDDAAEGTETLAGEIVVLYGEYTSAVTLIEPEELESNVRIELLSDKMSLFSGTHTIFKTPPATAVGIIFSMDSVPVV